MEMTTRVRPSMRVLGLVLGLTGVAATLVYPPSDGSGWLSGVFGFLLAGTCANQIRRARWALDEHGSQPNQRL